MWQKINFKNIWKRKKSLFFLCPFLRYCSSSSYCSSYICLPLFHALKKTFHATLPYALSLLSIPCSSYVFYYATDLAVILTVLLMSVTPCSMPSRSSVSRRTTIFPLLSIPCSSCTLYYATVLGVSPAVLPMSVFLCSVSCHPAALCKSISSNVLISWENKCPFLSLSDSFFSMLILSALKELSTCHPATPVHCSFPINTLPRAGLLLTHSSAPITDVKVSLVMSPWPGPSLSHPSRILAWRVLHLVRLATHSFLSAHKLSYSLLPLRSETILQPLHSLACPPLVTHTAMKWIASCLFPCSVSSVHSIIHIRDRSNAILRRER